MGQPEALESMIKEFEEDVEDARSDLIQHDELVLLEALVRSTIIDPETGKLTDYWMSLLKPELLFNK